MRPPDPGITTPTTSCSSASPQKSVLLLTGRGQVSDEKDENFPTSARFLFDDGSMRTYMTESLRAKLGLLACETDVCDVSGFGGHTSGPQQVDIVKLRV